MVRGYDIHFMKMALGLARRGLGRVAPNPAVGCVIVSEEGKTPRVIARGWTQPGGRPHAETDALDKAGDAARGATAYVSLEPCSHHGKTGPCAEALIKAGITRVVGAVSDPDPRVSGRGFAMLNEAGIEVVENVCAAEASEINEGFFLTVREKRPLATLKVASSLDGRIATSEGKSKWITGELARNHGHLLRATHDAIMVGSTTAIKDDPELTCRLPGLEKRSPIRIVADGRLRLPLTSKLVRDARSVPTWVLTRSNGDADRCKAFEDCGITLIEIEPDADGLMDLRQAMREIASRGVTRLLVEGGARLASSMMIAGLVDRIKWFRSASLIGGDGLPAIAGLGIKTPDLAPSFVLRRNTILGADLLSTYSARK